MNHIQIKIARAGGNSDLPLPRYMTAGSAGFDLPACLSEPVTLKPGGRSMISTGFVFEIPNGYEGQVRPRSGLAAKYGITTLNAPGTVDSDYRGEVRVILINLGDKEFVVNHGERIAQMVIAPVIQAELTEISHDEMTETTRGSGGFGHTGAHATHQHINVRQESAGDREHIKCVVYEAFKTAAHADGDEHNLVGRLRDSNAYVPELSLVAELGGEIVGHIMFTKVDVGGTTQLALAPLAVSPAHQKSGVGSTLVKRGHEIARGLGYNYSIVLGDTAYYSRFGYIEARHLGIVAPFDVPSENFMAVKLNPNAPIVNGVVSYAKAFFEKAE